MKLIVKPHSGLGNRLRVMVSGLVLARELKCDYEIIWAKDQGINCAFNNLFKHSDKYNIKKVNLRAKIVDLLRSKLKLLHFIKLFLRIKFVMYDQHISEYVWSTGTNIFNINLLPSKGGDIYINTCHEFYFHDSGIVYFKPIDTIEKRVLNNIINFNQFTIGVHIRRKDNFKSIEKSTLSEFKRLIDMEIDKNSLAKFYIASDDSDVKNELLRDFGKKIITGDFSLQRNTSEGIQAALVELITLSRTCKIYGSYWSSYSDMASRIGNVPLCIVEK